MHTLIASPFLADYLILRPDHRQAVKIGRAKFAELLGRAEDSTAGCPPWLADAARQRWGLDVAGKSLAATVLVRSPSAYGFGRASYELNLGCNYDCEHCYLGLKRFEGLDWDNRERLLHILRDAGVLWLQLTGGEPTIDRLFPDVYTLAWDFGMMVSVSSNGSRLHDARILDMLTTRRPYRLTLSVYGATEDAYDGLTRRRGSFKAFMRGLSAAHEAGLPINLNLVVTRHNEHEVDDMRALAERYSDSHAVFSNISPTIYSGAETLPSQSEQFLRERKPFTGCGAGHTHFHVDPHGMASICKVGRDPNVSLIGEGIEGLRRLGDIADSLMLRTGGCSGCALSGQCYTCRPLAKLYQEAKAPLTRYCQHGRR
ncbi:radical SAM protein [Saccharothrix deserti]|uniref:radical SAM protein n=1 Tax=Saccharothrix deserti TaxID=2593674 RepID=UPI00131E28F9|nr:radical SAM protein [Saccharothrix deserti]